MFQDKCKSCGAAIFWGQTKAGKQMPVDFRSNPFGNLRVTVPADPREPVVIEVVPKEKWNREGAEASLDVRHTSHFATCPNAAQHRGRLV